ncbi:UNVERIFIED_CONTAM: hypothetical protein HHA_312905 [Hammondia hammondi]|eukprot:XP_008883628.1 hypothetical protein HHA_312905 [Hammondia hammondi]
MEDADFLHAPCGDGCWRLRCRELQHADLYHGAEVWLKVPRKQRGQRRTEDTSERAASGQLAGDFWLGLSTENGALARGDTAGDGDAPGASARTKSEDRSGPEPRRDGDDDEDEQVVFMPRVLQAVCGACVRHSGDGGNPASQETTREGGRDREGRKRDQREKRDCTQLLPSPYSVSQSERVDAKAEAGRKAGVVGTVGDGNGESETRRTGGEGRAHQDGDRQEVFQRISSQGDLYPQTSVVPCRSSRRSDEGISEKLRDVQSRDSRPSSSPALRPSEPSSRPSAVSTSLVSPSSVPSLSDSCSNPCSASFLTPSSDLSPSSASGYLSCSSPCGTSSLPQSASSPCCLDADRDVCCLPASKRKESNEESALPSPRSPSSSSDSALQQGSSCASSRFAAQAAATLSEKTQKEDASGTTQASVLPSPPGPSTRMYILPMARGEWVRVDSTIWFRVLRGTVEVRGHLFPPSRNYQLVSCPVWSPTVRILAVGAPGTASARLRRACAKTAGGPSNECQDARVTTGASRNALEAEVSRLSAKARVVTTQAASDAVSVTHAGAEEGQSDFRSARDRCACSQLEKQFVEFTGGDAEAVSSLFTASVDSLPRRFLSGPRGGGATASAKTVGPALRRLLQVDEKLRAEVVPSVEVGEALKRIPKKRYPVVLCFAQVDTPCGPVPIHSAVEPPAPACLYRPLEILPPSWRYVAFELLRIFASEELPSLLPVFSASRPGIKWICSPCLSERSSACIPEETYRQCANGQRRLPVAVLWGSKGAGKSTFSYFLLNFLLNFFPRVAYLEADVGQPTFTLPGCVSLLEVSEPLLTPPHMLVDSLDVSTLQGASPVGEGRRNKLMENLFFGDISPKSAPHLYLRCISRCISTYCEHIQGDRRSALRSASATVSADSPGAFSYPSSVSAAASLASSASAQPASSAFISLSSSCLCPSSPVVSKSAVSPSAPAVSSSPSVSSFAAKFGLESVASAAKSNRQNRAKHMQGEFACLPPTVPLVVNTPGWVEGLGESLLSSIQAMSKASACIQFFDSPNKEEDLGERVSCGTDDVQCEEARARRETKDRLVEASKGEESNERGAKSEEDSREEATAREARMANSPASRDGCDGRSRGAAVNIKRQRGGDRLEAGEGVEDCLPHNEAREEGQWRKLANDSERERDESKRAKRKRVEDVEFSANGERQGEGSVRTGSGHTASKQRVASLSGDRIASQARKDREEPGGSTQTSQENSTCPSRGERQAEVVDAGSNPNNGLSRSLSPRFSSSRSAAHLSSAPRTSLTSSLSSSTSSSASTSSASSPLGRRLSPAGAPVDESSPACFSARLQRLCSRSFPGFFSHRILLHPCRAPSPASSSSDRPGLSPCLRRETPRVVACPYVHDATAQEREREREQRSQQGDRGSVHERGDTCRRGTGKKSASSSVRVCECCGKGGERRDCRLGDDNVSDARRECTQQTALEASTNKGGDTCDPRRGRNASANPQAIATEGRRVRVSVPEILECIQSVEHPNTSPLAAHPLFAADVSIACGCGVHIFSVPSFKQHLSYLHQSPLPSASTQLPLVSSPLPSPFSRERERGSPFVSGLLPLSFNASFNLETGRRYRRVYDEVVSASSEDDEAGAVPHASPVGGGDGTTPTRGRCKKEERRGRKPVRTPRAKEEETAVECRDEDEDIDTESGPKTDGEDETVWRGRSEKEKRGKDLEAKTEATMHAGERREAEKEDMSESCALHGEHETAGMSDASRSSEVPRMKRKEAGEERPVVVFKKSDSDPEQRTGGVREEVLRATGEGKEKLENPSSPGALEWRREAALETRGRRSSSRSQQVDFRVPRGPLAPVSLCPLGCCFSSAALSPSSSSCSRSTSPGLSPPVSPLAVSCSCRSPSHLFPRCVDPFERPPAPSPAELRWLRLLSHFVPSSRSLLFRSGLPRFSWESLCSFFLTVQDNNTERGCLPSKRTRSDGRRALCPTAEEEQEEVRVRRGVGDEVAENEEAENVEPDLEGDSRKSGRREAAACLSKAQILCASSLLPLESPCDASLSRASASSPATSPSGLSAGRCAETWKRKADDLALPRPTARKWVWISLEKIQIALRECDALLVGCRDATGGVRGHLCSASATEKILSCLPAMTVALAISAEREKHNFKRSIPHVAALCTEMMPKSRSEGPSSFRKGRKPCRLKIVEATENFTCVCYAVVMRVNRRSHKLLCLIGGSASLLGDIVKRVDTVMLGEGIHFNPCPPEASHTSKNSDSLKSRQIHGGKTEHTPTPFYAFPFRTVDLRSLSFSQFPCSEDSGRTADMSEANEPDELSISRPKMEIPAFDLICQSSRALFRGTELLDLGNSGKMSAAFFSRNGTPFRPSGQSSRAQCDMNDRSGMKHSDRQTGGDMSTLVRDARTGDTPLSAAFDTAGCECRNQVTTRVISSKVAVRRPGRSAGVRQGLAR